MSTLTQTFGSEKAFLTLGKILDFARQHASFTCVEAMSAAGLGESATRGYLLRLISMGDLRLVSNAKWSHGGTTAAEYAVSGEAVDDDRDYSPRRVVVRTSWPANHQRMEMDCLLFGVPAAMQRVAV